jgi:hypothetical protein
MSAWGEQYSHVHSNSVTADPGHPWIPGSLEKNVDALAPSPSTASDSKGALADVIAKFGTSTNLDTKCSDIDANSIDGSENESHGGNEDDSAEDEDILVTEDGDFMDNLGNFAADQDINDIMEQLLAAETLDTDPIALLANLTNNAMLAANNANSTTKNWNLFGVDPPIYATIDEPLTAYDPNRLLSVHSDTPLQGTLSGVGRKLYGYNGEELQYTYNDLSHYGLSLSNTPGIIDLPFNFTDLYEMVKGDGILPDAPALCLLCGKVVHAANRRRERTSRLRMVRDPGECTLHSRDCGAGVGVFFLLKQCKVLLIRDNHCVTLPSIYLDSRGEAGESRFHVRPLFLSTKRYQRLKELYLKHLIGREVARVRSSGDEVIVSGHY